MHPTNISFDGATDFEITGGNFGTVQGDLRTINVAARRSRSHSSTRRAGPRHQRSSTETDYSGYATRTPSVTSTSSLESVEEFGDEAGQESDYSSPPSSFDMHEIDSTMSSLGGSFVHLPRPFARVSSSPLSPVIVASSAQRPAVPSTFEHRRNHRSDSSASVRSTPTNRSTRSSYRGGDSTTSPFARPSNPEPGQAPGVPPPSSTPTSRSNLALSTSSNDGDVRTPRSRPDALASSPRSNRGTTQHSSRSHRSSVPTPSGTVYTPPSSRHSATNRDAVPLTVQSSNREIHSSPLLATPASNHTRLAPPEQTPHSVENFYANTLPNRHSVLSSPATLAPEGNNRVFSSSSGESNHAMFNGHNMSSREITVSMTPSPSPSGPPFDPTLHYRRGSMDVRSPYPTMHTAPFPSAVWPPNPTSHHSHQWAGQQMTQPYAQPMPFHGPVHNGYGTPFQIYPTQNYPMGWGGAPYGWYPPR
ncbi:hypothetical protein NP233_g2924 [Leucocoprinus birnbaumii]|uniref:Uncharacterized protein n=1 Tax=Leucocoprinus birnbaumii TaxID=56174 RepID=A0AAD5W0H6_9AGAR|nr:hypothetical protein NP233_g2924 [Leucocoprinus birnbaumii]